MSDLIDLTSPDREKVSTGPKLSSPLIPLPTDNSVESPHLIPNLNLGCRRSMENNPFDVELQKTNEFISKSDDPFEVVWQRAVNAGDTKSHSAEFKKPSSSIHVMNDSRSKRERHSDYLKMNKTLNSPFTNTGVSSFGNSKLNHSVNNVNGQSTLESNDYKSNELSVNGDSRLEIQLSKSCDNLPLLSINPPSPDYNDLSILNQSVMNDSFLLCSPTGRPSIGKTLNSLTSCGLDLSHGKDATSQHNSSILNQSAMNDSLSGSSGSDNGLIKSIVARRIAMCIQKGISDAETELKIPDGRYQRLRRSFSQGDQLSLKNFQQVHSLSSVGDTRLRTPDDCSISAILYEDPFNQGFMTKSSGDDTTTIDISAISSIKRINSAASSVSSGRTYSVNNLGFLNDSNTSARTTSNGERYTKSYIRHSSASSLAEISDLVAKFDRLKAKTLHQSLNTKSSLIDLDKENSSELNMIQHQHATSDTVFFDNNSISQPPSSDELAKTFRKCSLTERNGSDTNSDDSLPKRPPSVMGLLSDHESSFSNHNSAITGNLIELQTSNTNKIESLEEDELVSANDEKDNNNGKNIDVIKEFDRELIAPDKKITAGTLLMELEKLVNNEKNPKAVEILKNLERVLGVKCDNNVELLEMYVQNTEPANHVEDNLTDKGSPLGESQIPNVDTSKEDNTNVDSSDSPKQLNCKNIGINNNHDHINTDKITNKNIQLPEKSDKPVDKPQNSFNMQKLVVDIQIALQNLLTNNNSDPMVFLEIFNKVLNPSTNESGEKLEKNNQIIASPVRCIPTSPLKRLEVLHSSMKSTTMRRSVGSTSALNEVRTSNGRNTKIKTRIDSPKKSISKRSSSDPDTNDDTKITKKIPLDSIKLKPSVAIVNKKKLRSNNESTEKMVKKGPLKAFLPISNMQQRGSSLKKVTPLLIPVYSPSKFSHEKSSTPMVMTSTPNPDVQVNLDSLRTSPKRRPVASSTPDVNNRISRVKIPKPSSPKHNISWNISPVTPNEPRISTPIKNSSLRDGSLNLSQKSNKKLTSPKSKNRSTQIRSDKTPDGSKKISLLPRDPSPSRSGGKLRYGRRSEPVKSTEAVRKIASPLKENNTPSKKINPLNLISRFQRRSSAKPTEKENKWK